MKKLYFEISQTLWIKYMVWHIFCKYAYPTLQPIPPVSYEEWCKPDMYSIDGINEKELPKQYQGEGYLSSEIESFNEWFIKQ